MKRILVLGGVGAMASETTRDLLATSDFGEITVADVDLPKARAFVEELGDQRLKAVGVDAEDVEATARLMEGQDVIANGLPRQYCRKAILAAIKAIFQPEVLVLLGISNGTYLLGRKAGKTAANQQAGDSANATGRGDQPLGAGEVSLGLPGPQGKQ